MEIAQIVTIYDRKAQYAKELLGPGADGNDGRHHDIYSDDHNTKKIKGVWVFEHDTYTLIYLEMWGINYDTGTGRNGTVNYYAILARGDVMDE